MLIMCDDGIEREPISRKDATALGAKRYFTGEPCVRGHMAERDIVGKTCYGCRTTPEYREANRIRNATPEFREVNRIRQAVLRHNEPRRGMINNARRRVAEALEERNLIIPFSITIDDIVVPEFCPALRIPLIVGKGKIHPNSPSLDRIIPELGYVKGNIIVISHLANCIKNSGTWEQIL